jgi:hypothetical protein
MIKGIKVAYILLFLGVYSRIAFSQSVANYSVVRTTGNVYNSIISTGTSFSGWRYTGAFSEDDNRSDATDIGFDFWYNGQRYTQFSVSTNGFLDFSSSTDDGGPQAGAYGYFNDAFSASTLANATWLALAPFYDDMTTGTGTNPLGNSIKYELSGAAPNRVLTVEWYGMAVYLNTSPNINFQVKLYETTGVIEYNYGTMNAGTNTFSYTVGINAASISNSPTASQLKTQQIANTATFSNSPQNNLSTMPAANSRLRFSAPVATAASGAFTLSNVSPTSMTLNWPNWASNEVGYVIYSSTDNVNFYFSTQTAVNATSTTVTGLLPSTIYYWRVYAVTEGSFSAALSANGSTLSAATITSIRTGNWDATNTWDCGCVPSAGDNVLIKNGHTVSLRTNSMQCNNLTIGQGASGTVQFTTNTTRTLTIHGDLIINSGASLTEATNSNTTHTLNFRGNIINNGTLNLSPDANSLCNAVFIRTTGNQTVSGAGTTFFHTIQIDKNLKTNILDIATTNFTCNQDALSFVSGGTFKFSSTGANSFQLFNSLKNIPSNARIWMNSANSTMSFGAGVNLQGDLRLENGTLMVGNAANENLISWGGTLEINGGSLSIAGNYGPNTAQSTSKYVQTGGLLTVPSVSSTSTTISPFSMTVVGSTFSMSGGTIVIAREGGSGTQNLGYNTSGVTQHTLTGGTFQIGNTSTPANQIVLINSGTPIGNLVVNSSHVTSQLIGNDLTVLNDITIVAGMLSDNGRNITFGKNWLATNGIFTRSLSSTVTANGGNQSITTAGSAFNNLTLSGTGIKSFQDNLLVNGNLTLSSTFRPVNNGFTCTIGGSWTNNGSFIRNGETVLFNGTTNQNISGTSTTDFTNITVNKTGGSVSVNGTANLHQTLTIQSSTTFDADGDGGGVFTILSSGDTPVVDGRVATLAGSASVTGNVTVQRYMAPEVTNVTRVYRYISSPVSGQFVSDWQDDFPITGTFTNPNTEFPSGSGLTNVCGINLIPNSPSLYQYVEANAGSGASDLGWVKYPNGVLSTVAPLHVGRGYAAFIRDCTNPTIVDVRGPINQGVISFNSLVTRTINGDLEDGFNLVGNPYPSAIDWDTDAGWTRTGISPVIYIRDNGAGGGFITYDHTDNIPLVIAMGQAFWVRATGTPSFSINEQAKTGNPATFYRTASPNKLSINLTNGAVTDKAIVKINSESSNKFDDFDGPKLDNSLFEISTLSEDGIKMAVNSMNKINCGTVLPIMVKNLTVGSYEISFERLGEFQELDVELYDRYTNSTVTVSNTSIYSFSVSANASSKATNRFELRVANQKEIDRTVFVSSVPITCGDKDGLITIDQPQEGIDYFATRNGLIVSDSIVGVGQRIELVIPSQHLELGDNHFVIKASGKCGGAFDLVEQPTITLQSVMSPQIVTPSPQCQQGSVVISTIDIPEGSIVNWYSDPLGEVLFSGTSYRTPVLSKSKTYFASQTSKEGCEGARVPVKVPIIKYDEISISINADTLIASYSENVQWYLNDEPIENANSNKYLVTSTGVYRVEALIPDSQCKTSAEISMVITGNEESRTDYLHVYPSPVQDTFEIKIPKAFDNTVYLLDTQGRKMATILLSEDEMSKVAIYNVSHLAPGIYWVQAFQSNKPAIFKLVKL